MLKFLGSLVLWNVNALTNGFVLWKLYEWFVAVPPFFAPHITYWHGFALGFFGSWLDVLTQHRVPGTLKTDYTHFSKVLLAKTINMWLLLGVAALIQTYLM